MDTKNNAVFAHAKKKQIATNNYKKKNVTIKNNMAAYEMNITVQ